MGFSPRPGRRTSHEQWIKEEKGELKLVTEDCPKSPFSQDLIKWMARQAGVSKDEFYNLIWLIYVSEKQKIRANHRQN